MKRFSGQVAVVTGAARGIGRAIAERLADEGAQVILFDVLEGELNSTCRELEAKGLEADMRIVDISDEAATASAFSSVMEKYQRLDVLVNSAGIVGPTSTKILDYAAGDFEKVIRINLLGSFFTTKSALAAMVRQGYGRILHLSSIAGKEGNPGMVGYASSKAGVIGLVKGVAKEYADTGVTINGLAPAVIGTPMNLETDPKMMEYMTQKIPMGRIGTIEEAAAIACWIVSPEASFTTGFIFDLSGGRATY